MLFRIDLVSQNLRKVACACMGTMVADVLSNLKPVIPWLNLEFLVIVVPSITVQIVVVTNAIMVQCTSPTV